jgi:predicted nucleic acid-binding protein
VKLTVIDASVAVKWVLAETGGAAAEEILQQYGEGKVQLIAPRLLSAEVASAISTRCRRKLLTPSGAQKAYGFFEAVKPILVDESSLMHKALSLAVDHHLSFWASVYLAVAIAFRADLVTADARFYRSTSRHYPFVRMLG